MSHPSSPTGAALATASELAARPVPAPAVPPASSAAAGGNANDSKSTAVGIGAVSATDASASAINTARPGVGPRQNSKKELMDSAHLLCSLFGGGSGSNSPSRTAAAPVDAPASDSSKAEAAAHVAVPAVTPPTTLVRHGSKGPLKKRMMMPVLDDADDNDDDNVQESAVDAQVAWQAAQRQKKRKARSASHTAVSSTTSALTTGTTGTPTGDYCTLLYTPGEDEIYLSPQLCLTRAQIEAFEAQPADVNLRRSSGGRSTGRTLAVGHVGLRCIH